MIQQARDVANLESATGEAFGLLRLTSPGVVCWQVEGLMAGDAARLRVRNRLGTAWVDTDPPETISADGIYRAYNLIGEAALVCTVPQGTYREVIITAMAWGPGEDASWRG